MSQPVRVKLAVATHRKYKDLTVPVLMRSLQDADVPQEDIMIVVGGYARRRKDVRWGVEVRNVTHNSFDHTALIEILEHGVDAAYTHIFALHDTCQVGPNFYKLLSDNAALPADNDFVGIHFRGAFAIGALKSDYLEHLRQDVLKLKDCSKHDASNPEVEYIYAERVRDGKRSYFGSPKSWEECFKDQGWKNVYGGKVERRAFYFPCIDVCKFQANNGEKQKSAYIISP